MKKEREREEEEDDEGRRRWLAAVKVMREKEGNGDECCWVPLTVGTSW